MNSDPKTSHDVINAFRNRVIRFKKFNWLWYLIMAGSVVGLCGMVVVVAFDPEEDYDVIAFIFPLCWIAQMFKQHKLDKKILSLLEDHISN